MSVLPAGTSGLGFLFNWPRWLYSVIGAFAMFKLGNVVMAGAVSFAYHHDPTSLEILPVPGWQWYLNIGFWLVGGILFVRSAYKVETTFSESEEEE